MILNGTKITVSHTETLTWDDILFLAMSRFLGYTIKLTNSKRTHVCKKHTNEKRAHIIRLWEPESLQDDMAIVLCTISVWGPTYRQTDEPVNQWTINSFRATTGEIIDYEIQDQTIVGIMKRHIPHFSDNILKGHAQNGLFVDNMMYQLWLVRDRLGELEFWKNAIEVIPKKVKTLPL